MRIHSIISIAQLKSSIITITGASDPYEKKINTKPPFVHNEGDEINDEFEINKIINKRIINEKLEYLFK